MSMMDTLGTLIYQILLLNELERSHEKEGMLPINHIQCNVKRDMRGYYDLNVLSTPTRNTKETVVLHAASDLVCFTT